MKRHSLPVTLAASVIVLVGGLLTLGGQAQRVVFISYVNVSVDRQVAIGKAAIIMAIPHNTEGIRCACMIKVYDDVELTMLASRFLNNQGSDLTLGKRNL